MSLTENDSDQKILTSSVSIKKRLEIIYRKVDEHKVEKAWKRFNEAGFKPILIKGWAASLYYDIPAERRFNDIDLALFRDEYSIAQDFLAKSRKDIEIDLHKEVRYLDTVDFKTLYNSSHLVECGTTAVRVLRPEDHLRIVCVHWLIDGGAKRERLLDIYYAVKNRPANFDWDACLNVVSPKRRRWIVCTIGLAHKYLDLNIEDTPISSEAKDLPDWLIKAVEKEWQSGVFIIPMHLLLNDWKSFWQQLKKRIPPNPIQATVEMDGDFDKYPRAYYQFLNVFYRLTPFLKRSWRRLKG